MPLDMLNALPRFIDALVIIFILVLGQTLSRVRQSGATQRQIYFVLFIVLAWGLAWSVGPLKQIRLDVPVAQPLAILTSIVFLTAVGFMPPGKQYFRTVPIKLLLQLGLWRVIFGALLIVSGLAGRLPDAFFWSAGIGDILAGLWALALANRTESSSRHMLLACNVFGLFDLVHVLSLGALFLAPFFLANPKVEFLTLLPFVGVPTMIAIHIHTFRTINSLFYNQHGEKPSISTGSDPKLST
jgi:hypothetical protein